MPQRECAFCPSTAKLSAEHIWSRWISELHPGKKLFRHYGPDGNVTKEWLGEKLNWTAKVVCEQCNNTWMSDIENIHAKPALSELIAGNSDVAIEAPRARSIALFCFKTALVVDLISPLGSPFFRKTERYAFRTFLAIPEIVNIWMTKLVPRGKGRVNSRYGKASISPVEMVRSYICTFATGHFVFQLVAIRSSRPFEPLPGFEHLAIPFYPRFRNFTWPPICALSDTRQFEIFATRWTSLTTPADWP